MVRLLFAGFEFLYYFILRPSAWHSFVARLDPKLSPNFCLSQTPIALWRDRSFWRFLVGGYLLLPLWGALLPLIVGLFFNANTLMGVVGLGVGILFGLLIGFTVTAASGLVVSLVAAVTLQILWSNPSFLFIDMVLRHGFVLLYSLIAAIVIAINSMILLVPLRQSAGSSLLRQINGAAFGLLTGFFYLLLYSLILITIVYLRGGGFLSDSVTFMLSVTAPALLIAILLKLRGATWQGSLVGSLFSCLIQLLLSHDLQLGFGDNIGGERLLLLDTISFNLIFLWLFVSSYAAALRITDHESASVISAFVSLAIHPLLWLLIQLYSLSQNLLIALAFIALGLTLRWILPLLRYPFEVGWGNILLRIEQSRQQTERLRLQWHPVFWDDVQNWKLFGLDEYLIFCFERDPLQGQSAIDAVSASRQRWAAQAAQIELDARTLERCLDVEAIATIHTTHSAGLLAGPASALLHSMNTISKNVATALNQNSLYHRRLALATVIEDIDSLLRELTRSDERYAQRFQPIALQWREVVDARVTQLIQESILHEEIPNPYVVGAPLSKQQSVFVGRIDISRRIEELAHKEDYPPLLLYGQRRMGKTTLLNNLQWLLSSRIAPLVVDLQGPISLSPDAASFLYNLAKGMQVSANRQELHLPSLERELLKSDPYTLFDDWLDAVERELLSQKRSTILLALDEFETLDYALSKGPLDGHAILSTFRHITQHRPRFKLLFAGSHSLDEFQHWSSYLINAQTIHLSYLTENEGRMLIEHPLQEFPLSYEPSASQFVWELTRGHPYLLQLLCSEIVTLKNEQPAARCRLATVADVEQALPHAQERGHQFFADIEMNQVNPLELRLARTIAANHSQGVSLTQLRQYCPDQTDLQQSLATLLRRQLLEQTDTLFRFQVELIRRWFAQA